MVVGGNIKPSRGMSNVSEGVVVFLKYQDICQPIEQILSNEKRP